MGVMTDGIPPEWALVLAPALWTIWAVLRYRQSRSNP